MKKTIITTLLVCTGLIAAGCEKIHSVEEFKKDESLREKWIPECMWRKPSQTKSPQNCENLEEANSELRKESIQELINKYREKYPDNDDKQKAKEQSEKQQNNN